MGPPTVLLLYQVVRLVLSAISAVLGGVGIFALYASFYDPAAAVIAILMLTAATAIVRAINQQ